MPNETLPKSFIIHHKDELELLFTSGKRRYGKYIMVIYLPAEAGDPRPCAVAFLCGKRIGNAVKRNLYKRRFREIFRKNKPAFQGLRILLMAQPTILKSDFEVLQADVLAVIAEIRK